MKNVGKEFSSLRSVLGYSQEDVCGILQMSRGALGKLEKSQDIEDISYNSAFRMYYFAMKILEKSDVKDFIKLQAKKIKELAEERIAL